MAHYALERAYRDAEETGKPRILLIPTQELLPPVDPLRAAQRWTHEQYVAMCTVSDALIEIYQSPEPAIIRKFVAELDALANAVETAQREYGPGKHG
jgi:hypothetical protein